MARDPKSASTPWQFAQLAAALLERKYGPEPAKKFLDDERALLEARERTKLKRQRADQIGQARLQRGEGVEMDADLEPPPPTPPAPHRSPASAPTARERSRGVLAAQRPADPLTSPKSARRPDEASERGVRNREDAKTKQAQRQHRRLQSVLQRRHARDLARSTEQAEKLAEQALLQHGIRHHYRALPKLAFFAGYMAGLDRNGVLARQVLRTIGAPAWWTELVLKAAYEPNPYAPRRNVCSGQREDQKRFEGRQRPFGEAPRCVQWEDAQRQYEHPGAIRVIQCAIFLWLSKGRTRRKGFSFCVRGFGRGVFCSIAQCGKDAITGHNDGLPGALVALKQVGAIQYGQPPAQKATEIDKGPSGHAYNVYWIKSTADELALEQELRRVAEIARLPPLQRSFTDASWLLERMHVPRAQAPPTGAPTVA